MEYFSEISWFLLEKCSSSLKKQFSFERSNSFNQVLLWIQELQSFWKEVLSNAKMAISFWDDALKKKAEIIAAWKIKQSFQTAQYPCKETAFDWQRFTPHSTRKNGGHQFSTLSLMLWSMFLRSLLWGFVPAPEPHRVWPDPGVIFFTCHVSGKSAKKNVGFLKYIYIIIYDIYDIQMCGTQCQYELQHQTWWHLKSGLIRSFRPSKAPDLWYLSVSLGVQKQATRQLEKSKLGYSLTTWLILIQKLVFNASNSLKLESRLDFSKMKIPGKKKSLNPDKTKFSLHCCNDWSVEMERRSQLQLQLVTSSFPQAIQVSHELVKPHQPPVFDVEMIAQFS